MSVLRTLESKLAGLVEGTFSRAFKSEVRPVEIARKLAKEMDDHRVQSLSRTYAPNEYVVWLSPDDRALARLRHHDRRRQRLPPPRRGAAVGRLVDRARPRLHERRQGQRPAHPRSPVAQARRRDRARDRPRHVRAGVAVALDP